MTIRLGWKRASDGELLARIMTIRYLTREQLTGALIAATIPHARADLKDLTRAEIEEAIRSQLERHADAMNWWQDEYREYYADEDVTAEEAEAWAQAQIVKVIGS